MSIFHYEVCGVVDGELGSVGLTIPRSVETIHQPNAEESRKEIQKNNRNRNRKERG